MTGITPFRDIATQFKDKKGEWERIVVTRDKLPEVMDHIVNKIGFEELYNFQKLLRKSLIIELRSLPPSRHYGLLKHMSESSKPLREQIIDAINEGFDKLDRDNVGITRKGGDDTARLTVTINHPLLLALNNGTGIYGEKGQEIRPVTKQYLFIPGADFAQKYFMKYYTGKIKGMSGSKIGRVKTEFQAQQLYDFHKSRMVHSRAIKQTERYSKK